MHDSATSGALAKERSTREVIFGVLFAFAGALLGGIAGSVPGAVVGLVIGAGLGAVAGWSLHSSSVQQARHEASLDRVIGTEGGDIGAPGLAHPPPRSGALSREASGISSSVEDTEAAGPILRPPD